MYYCELYAVSITIVILIFKEKTLKNGLCYLATVAQFQKELEFCLSCLHGEDWMLRQTSL